MWPPADSDGDIRVGTNGHIDYRDTSVKRATGQELCPRQRIDTSRMTAAASDGGASVIRDRRELGLGLAIGRIDDAFRGRTNPLIPFTEALWWLYSLHEWHVDHMPVRKREREAAFTSLCDQSDEGKTFKAIMWARNHELHAHRDVTQLVVGPGSGMYGSTTYDGTMYGGNAATLVWHWARTADVRRKPRSGGVDLRATYYEDWVSERPLMVPLRAAELFVSVVRAAEIFVSAFEAMTRFGARP